MKNRARTRISAGDKQSEVPFEDSMNASQGNDSSSFEGGEGIYEQGKELWQEAGIFAEVASNTIQDVRSMLKERLTKSPYRTLGMALGVGYFLAGGLPGMWNSLLWSTVGRFAAKAVLRKVLGSLSGRMVQDDHSRHNSFGDDSEETE